MASINHPSPPAHVAAVFDSYPPNIRSKLLRVRKLILTTAAATQGVGPLTETLKWGEPAYLTEKSKSGSTIRIAWKEANPTHYAMYFNCQTSLVDTFRTLFPELKFEGNRALIFDQQQALPTNALKQCIEMALTYHLQKKARASKKA